MQLSLIVFLSWVAFGVFLHINGEHDWWLTIPIAFACLAGIWIIYWIICFVCRCSARNIILWLGIIVLVLMCIFPPWNRVRCLPSSNIKALVPVGYYPLMCPPEGGVEIAFSRLFLQLFVVSVITGGLIYTFRDKKSKKA